MILLFIFVQSVFGIAPPAPPYSETFVSINYVVHFSDNVTLNPSMFLSGFNTLLLNDTVTTIYAQPPIVPPVLYLIMTNRNTQLSSINNFTLFSLNMSYLSSAVNYNVSSITFLSRDVNVFRPSPDAPPFAPMPPSPPNPYPPPISPPSPPHIPPNSPYIAPSNVSTVGIGNLSPPPMSMNDDSIIWIVTAFMIGIVCFCVFIGWCGIVIFKFANKNSDFIYKIQWKRYNVDIIKEPKQRKTNPQTVPKKDKKYAHIQVRH